MFMESISVAIWNKNKVVVAIASTIWGINSAFFFQGNSQTLGSPGHPSNLVVSGILRVNEQLHTY